MKIPGKKPLLGVCVAFVVSIILLSFGTWQKKDSTPSDNMGGVFSGVFPWGNVYYPELGRGRVEFTVIPLDTAHFWEFAPIGHIMLPQHPIPTAAGGFQFKTFNDPQPIRAPADGVITCIRYLRIREHGVEYDDYRLYLFHTNTFISDFDHLSAIDPSILSRISTLKEGFNQVYVPVKAGDVIAKTGMYIAGLGWYLYDLEANLNYVNKEKYGPMAYSVFPLDYFRQDLGELLYTFVRRTKEPRGGRADFDIDGTISGNWIVEGSDPRSGPESWSVWLSFCYDMYDPDCRRISIGTALGRTIGEENGVLTCPKGGPAYTEVTPASGPVVYRLYPVWEGQEFFGVQVDETIRYTLLVQMVDNRKIKVELFRGDVPNPSFTSKAMYYTR